MINSPSNPTGVVYDRAELEALADVSSRPMPAFCPTRSTSS